MWRLYFTTASEETLTYLFYVSLALIGHRSLTFSTSSFKNGHYSVHTGNVLVILRVLCICSSTSVLLYAWCSVCPWRTILYSRQSASSELSPQSLSVSQRQVCGTQRPLAQVNWLAGHVPGSCVGQLRSSLLSKQSLWPSQCQPEGTQRWLAQVNAEGEQVVSGGIRQPDGWITNPIPSFCSDLVKRKPHCWCRSWLHRCCHGNHQLRRICSCLGHICRCHRRRSWLRTAAWAAHWRGRPRTSAGSGTASFHTDTRTPAGSPVLGSRSGCSRH